MIGTNKFGGIHCLLDQATPYPRFSWSLYCWASLGSSVWTLAFKSIRFRLSWDFFSLRYFRFRCQLTSLRSTWPDSSSLVSLLIQTPPVFLSTIEIRVEVGEFLVLSPVNEWCLWASRAQPCLFLFPSIAFCLVRTGLYSVFPISVCFRLVSSLSRWF